MNQYFFCITVLSLLMMNIFSSCSEKDSVKYANLFLSKDEGTRSSLKLDAKEYMQWMEDLNNGIKVEKKIGDFTYTAMYKPYEYLALLGLKKDSIKKKELVQKISEYSDFQYFTFRISAENQEEELLKVGLKSKEDYYTRIEYFSFKMQNDLKLIDGKDTLNCALFHFERIYGLAPYATFIIGFPLSKEENEKKTGKYIFKNKTILFVDNVFGSGNVYMTIKEENLNRIPELITY